MIVTRLVEKTEETVNQTTGEIEITHTEETITHSEKTTEPSFIKLYLDHLAIYNGVPLTVNPIMAEFLKRTTYANEGQELVINAALKRQIAKQLKCSESKISNAMTIFVKKDYMRRIDRGLFVINPNLFGKGDWGNIRKLRANYDYIEHTVTVDIEGNDTAVDTAVSTVNSENIEE